MSLDPFEQGETAGGTVFRDVMLLALAGFIAIVLLLLPHLNPQAEEEDTKPPGNVIVEVFWPEGRDVDVDLWVKAPGDVPVGYSNRGSVYFNLLRDDLGTYKDPTPLNYEVAFSRGISAGEHVVNLHLYRDDGRLFTPVECRVVVTTVDPTNMERTQILETDLVMRAKGDERTAFRFALTEAGDLVPGSVNDTPAALRSPEPEPGN